MKDPSDFYLSKGWSARDKEHVEVYNDRLV